MTKPYRPFFAGNPDGAREAGRKGARMSAERRKKWLAEDELPPLDSVEAAQVWIERAGRACALGRLTSSQANSLCKAAGLYLESLEIKEALDELAELRGLVQRGRAS
jgi:hypothetical protein